MVPSGVKIKKTGSVKAEFSRFGIDKQAPLGDIQGGGEYEAGLLRASLTKSGYHRWR